MFVHLHCHSPFSFLDGASTIESLVAQTAMYGMPALALTDHNTVAGLPDLHKWAGIYGIKPISGAEITLLDGTHLTLLVETREGYENLCRLLTLAHTGEGRRRDPRLAKEDLFGHSKGLIVLSGCRKSKLIQLLRAHAYSKAKEWALELKQAFPDSCFLELQGDGYPKEKWLNSQLAELGNEVSIPIVAASNVHYVDRHQLPVHDVLRCIAYNCTIRTPHGGRPLNDMQWLHDAREAEFRFGDYPEAIRRSVEIAERCQVVLRLNDVHFPQFSHTYNQSNPAEFLRELVFQGAQERYRALDSALRERLNHELSMIIHLGYVDYFLVVWDIVRFARGRRIRCAGRGSAADSAVAYCLYITDVDAAGRGLLFERFMSLERAERPDIDIDFESDRRDEVMTYVYEKYGREHVARIATYQTFRGRSAIREIGAALSLPNELLGVLAKRVPWHAHADALEGLFDRVPELAAYRQYQSQLKWLWRLSRELAGFPKHYGMHVGGMIISQNPIFTTSSLLPSAKGEWMVPFDKHTAEDVGFVKLDLLSLRTMSAIEGAVRIREKRGQTLNYDEIPFDDEETFRMIRESNTIGVFQLESPAQRALQSRLRADNMEDIVASVALIRPGPIQGNMVDPFLARRHGVEPISYLHPKLEPILGKTYGVVLFQEQVIEIATAVANFTPGEADDLRRVMSRARSKQEMEQIGQYFVQKAIAFGIEEDVAETIFSYIQGYASYGFCEAHAAAFGATAYKTAYLVQHYPTEFYASILNQHPMGYYPVHVIVAEARRRKIRVLGVDVNQSEWLCTVPEENTIRLGFRMIKGMSHNVADVIVEEREQNGNFSSGESLVRRVLELDKLTVERFVRAGVLDDVSNEYRSALLWRVPLWFQRRLEANLPLVQDIGSDEFKKPVKLVKETHLRAALYDEYNLLGVGISGHWMSLYREELEKNGYLTVQEALAVPDHTEVIVAGLSVRPHRPPTKSGKTVVFFTLEDETGFLDVTMFESVYRTSGSILFTPYGRLIGLEGTIQRRGGERAQVIVSKVWSFAK